MIDHSLKLLGLGLVVAVAAGCPADDTEEMTSSNGTDNPTTGTPTSGSPTTNNPSTTDNPSTTEPPTTTDPDTGSDSSDTSPGACPGVPADGAAAGEACTANSECASGVCALFQDVPVDDDAVCGDMIDDCSTRITGTVFALGDAATPLEGVDVNIVAALDAITNPAGATPIASGSSNADGQVDFTSDGPISAAIAIIATAGGDGTPYFLSAAGVASDDGGYEVGVGLHEYHLVLQSDLDTWNAALDGDVDGSLLPIGPSGGIVGFVRGPDGLPVAGATVTPADDGSAAQIRYPQADGSISADMTDDTGLFIALGGMSTGEDYTAEAGGMSGSGTAGTANNVVFSMVLSIQ